MIKREIKNKDVIEFLETIPYRIGRNYVIAKNGIVEFPVWTRGIWFANLLSNNVATYS